jgi:hypothetical protein
MVFVTTQYEMPGDSLRGDKLLEQRRRKLDVLSGGATNNDIPGSPAIIVQILIRRDVQVEFVSVHRISVLPTKPEAGGKASTLRWHRGGGPLPWLWPSRRSAATTLRAALASASNVCINESVNFFDSHL